MGTIEGTHTDTEADMSKHIFNINPILPSEYGYTAFKIDAVGNDITQEDIDALKIPKYVGTMKVNYGITIDMTPNKSTGEVNERGIKRIAAFLKKAEGYCEYGYKFDNSVTVEEFCKYHNINY